MITIAALELRSLILCLLAIGSCSVLMANAFLGVIWIVPREDMAEYD